MANYLDKDGLQAAFAKIKTIFNAKLDADKVGAAGGVAPLTAASVIDAKYLPTNIEQVVELDHVQGEYYGQPVSTPSQQQTLGLDSSSCYRATAWPDVSPRTYRPRSGVVYVSQHTLRLYRWNGTALEELSPTPLERLTEAEINDAYDKA